MQDKDKTPPDPPVSLARNAAELKEWWEERKSRVAAIAKLDQLAVFEASFAPSIAAADDASVGSENSYGSNGQSALI